MPSPRKRRLKRAQGSIMGTTMTDAQKVDKGFVRNLVKAHAYRSGRGAASFVDGESPSSSIVRGGLISDMSDLDMYANAQLHYGACPAAGSFIDLTDGDGLTERFVFMAAAAGATGVEIVDGAGDSFSPRRYRVTRDGAGGGEETITALLVEAVKRLQIDFHHIPGGDDNAGTVDMQQKVAGTAGNVAIAHGDLAGAEEDGAVDDNSAAFVGGTTSASFGGGCSAMDAKHYFSTDHLLDAGAITVTHGVLWVQNPHYAASALADDDAKLKGIGGMPAGNDGNVLIDIAGANANDRLHIKAKAVGVALDAHIHATANVLNAALPNMVANLEQAGGNVALGQIVIDGNAGVITISTALPEVAKTFDFFPADIAGCVVHWFLEPI